MKEKERSGFTFLWIILVELAVAFLIGYLFSNVLIGEAFFVFFVMLFGALATEVGLLQAIFDPLPFALRLVTTFFGTISGLCFGLILSDV